MLVWLPMREKLSLICSSINPIFVAEALFEITLTRFSGDILPATDAGIVLSIADSAFWAVYIVICWIEPDFSYKKDELNQTSLARLKGNKLRSSSFCPCRAGKLAFSGSKMAALSRGNLFPKVVEAYSCPTRIVRGKEVDPDIWT
uniref:Uncharacterized protein n=1 Tax=Fagus sylvatica TaxID=28930 RepID=A0A2N9HNR1_FAGSY